MMGRTFCPLGDAAAMPTLGFIKKFRTEFEEYLEGKRVENPLIQIQPYGEPVLEGAH
jgi:NADH-quinone oxidoreductase subunit F